MALRILKEAAGEPPGLKQDLRLHTFVAQGRWITNILSPRYAHAHTPMLFFYVHSLR